MKKGQVIGGMVMNTIFILVVTQLSTGSLNPIEVFRGDSLLLKILIGFLGGTLVLGLLSLIILGSLDNVKCEKYGHSLTKFAGVYGNPIRCIACGRWYHTLCIKPDGGTALGGCKQANCPSGRAEVAHYQDV